MTAAAVTPASAARSARSRSALLALARVEGRRLLRHPVFVFGMVLSALILVLASGELTRHGVAAGAQDRTEIVNFLAGDVFVMVGAAFWTFIATFLAASRERRDAAEDFYAAQPVTRPARTAAALLSVGYAGLAAAALIGVTALVTVGVDGALTTAGARYSVRPIELAQGPLYVVMAGVLGVLLGSWTRHVYVGVFAAVMLFLPPVALVPWLALGDSQSRGYYGAFMAESPVGWHLLAFAGVTALAYALALARHDRSPRIALLGGCGLGALAAFAIAAPSVGLGAGCPVAPGAAVAGPGGQPALDASGNLDFERGDLSGWHTLTRGGGGWRAYAEAVRSPRPAGNPDVRWDVVAPPQGRFAALGDSCGPGSRALYRDLRLDGPRRLRFTLFYASAGPLASPRTLDHEAAANQQLRVDVMRPAAPVDSVAPKDVLATIFQTHRGGALDMGPRRLSFDLSPWAGRTVRIRFAVAENQAPLRAVVDDVGLDAIR